MATPEQLASITVIMGVGFLASIGANIVSIVKTFRRNPPIDQTLHEFARSDELRALALHSDESYARKSEFEVFRKDMQRNCSTQHSRIDQTMKEIFDIQRAMTKEVTDKLDRNYNAIAEWQRGIERQIGKLEVQATQEHKA
jgi:hypothetical protein